MRWPCNINKSRMVLLVALLFTVLGAGTFRTPSILFMAAVLCGAPILSALVGRFSTRGLRLKRQFPEVGTVGDVVVARLSLSNFGPLPAFLVHCGLVKEKEPFGGRKIAESSANERENLALEPAGEVEHVEAILGAGAQVKWEEKWHLRRRGAHLLTRAGAGTFDPLGLYGRLGVFTPPHEILVLPRPLKIGRLAWDGGTSGGIRPPQQAARVADAADFHGIRPHNPGEGLRRIHWKSTARTGQLHVIEWQEEMASDLTLFLDVQAEIHAGKSGDDSLEILVTLAATIASFLLESGHRFGMMWWEKEINPSSSRSGENADRSGASLHLRRFEARNLGGLDTILRALARLQLCHDPAATLTELVAQGASHVPAGQGVLLISSERSDAPSAARHLCDPSARVSCAQILMVEAASFETQDEAFESATQDPSPRSNDSRLGKPLSVEKAATKVASVTGLRRQTHQFIRRGDSLVAILERGT